MIIYGAGVKSIDLGRFATRHCSICERSRPIKLILEYKYEHLYWLKTVTEKQYTLLCAFCMSSSLGDAAEIEAKFEKHPIPFADRYGLKIFVSLLLAVIFLVLMSKINLLF